MKPFLALVRKDLKLYFTDRRAVVLTFIVPVLIAWFFGAILGGQSGKAKATGIDVIVVDLDSSRLSDEVVSALKRDSNLHVTQATESEARNRVRSGHTPVGIIIPKNFGAEAARVFFRPGLKPEIKLLLDPSRSAIASMVRGILMQHVMETVSKEAFGGSAGKRVIQESLRDLENATNFPGPDRQALLSLLGSVDKWMDRTQTSGNSNQNNVATTGLTIPFGTREEPLTSRAGAVYNGYAHSIAGMGVQFTLMAAIDLAVGLLLERQRGLWKRLRSAPISRRTLLGSKGISIALIAMSSLAFSFFFGIVVFGVQVHGSFAGFLLSLFAFALFAASAGLLLAAFGMTPGATRGLAIPVVLIMVMLGGAWVPAFLFPDWLQKITLAIPTRSAVDALDAMTWRGLGFNAVIVPVAVMLAYTAVFSWLAMAQFKWEAD